MFMEKAKTASECLHAYGIHTSTIQPEVLPCMAAELPAPSGSGTSGSSSTLAGSSSHEKARNACQLQCRGCQLGPGSVCCR